MPPLEVPTTLEVNNSASLSIGNEALTVIDDRTSRRRRKQYCCGLLSQRVSESEYNIDLYAILNVTVSDHSLTVTYVDGYGDGLYDAGVNAIQYKVREGAEQEATTWAKHLLECAYGQALPFKRLKVIINPFCSGAVAKYHTYAAPILAAAHCQVDVEETKFKGHASEIAEGIDLAAYDAIVCCSGDGLPHEVFNGLARRPDASRALTTMAVAMVPCGSGNAMAWNVFGTDNVSLAALAIVKGVMMPLDLLSITQGDKHTVSFLSQSLGVLADSDLKTEHLRWIGDSRFIYGVLMTIAQRTAYPCEIAIKTVMRDKKQIREYHQQSQQGSLDQSPKQKADSNGLSLRYGTVRDKIPDDWEVVPGEGLSSFYASNMPIVAKDTNFFPAALPNDGLLDVMTIDDTIGYAGALEAIIKLPQGRSYELAEVHMRKVEAYRVTPREKEGCISVDGEWYPFEAFQVEVHQGLGRVLSRSGRGFQTPSS